MDFIRSRNFLFGFHLVNPFIDYLKHTRNLFNTFLLYRVLRFLRPDTLIYLTNQTYFFGCYSKSQQVILDLIMTGITLPITNKPRSLKYKLVI